MKKFLIVILVITATLYLNSCNDFLDIVPDNTATIERSFNMRGQAEKALFTCYSYLTVAGGRQFPFVHISGATMSSRPTSFPQNNINIGNQNVVNPYLNYWEGRNGGRDLYEAIRKCNVFLDNIHKVGNMTSDEKEQWAAEAKFLKAYYYFFLIRMYGPVVLYKDNLSVADPDSEINVVRASLDSSFNYVKQLLNEVIHTPQLPNRVNNIQRDLGRITRATAYAMKAKVEVFSASPLFDGNRDYEGFQNVNGNNPFDTEENSAKWDSAAAAVKKAIDFAEIHNFSLYQYQTTALNYDISDSTILKMTIRNSFAGEQSIPRPNVLWFLPSVQGTGQPNYAAQVRNIPRGINNNNPSHFMGVGEYGPTFKMIDKFYTENGLPIDQDKSWDYSNRYDLQEVGENERFYLSQGYTTAKLNFHREARYYASLGFDGGIWYGNGSGVFSGGPDEYITIRAKEGQINSVVAANQSFSPTGYWIKKMVNYNTLFDDEGGGATISTYNKPMFRVADLYLLYAEAKNEADGPGPEVYEYVNKVRENVGLPTVQEAWSEWGNEHAWDYTTKEGMRKIIHRERLNELAFEGQRIWDLTRWKKIEVLNEPMRGWSIEHAEAEQYYTPTIVYNRNFSLKDYFWPISENELNINANLTQNPGW